MALRIVLLAACLAFLPLGGVRAQGSAAPPNPGFEAGELVPDGWTPVASQARAVFIWDGAEARSGQRSLYLRNYGPRWASWSKRGSTGLRQRRSRRSPLRTRRHSRRFAPS